MRGMHAPRAKSGEAVIDSFRDGVGSTNSLSPLCTSSLPFYLPSRQLRVSTKQTTAASAKLLLETQATLQQPSGYCGAAEGVPEDKIFIYINIQTALTKSLTVAINKL